MPIKNKIKIIIAEDHLLVRQGLVLLLKEIPNVEIIGQAENGIILLDVLKKKEPDIILLDIKMPLMNGFEAMQEIHKHHRGIKIIIISMFFDMFHISKFIKAGANAFLSKNSGIEKIQEAIYSVYETGKYVDDEVIKVLSVFDLKQNRKTALLKQKSLTKKEIEVLKLICAGNMAKEMAHILNVSIDTINYHKRNLKNKTACNSKEQLVVYAITQGVIPLR